MLVWQGVPQTWNPSQTVTTLEGAQQTIAFGPVASQELIKELGNNGGGFFNANSTHPFENPTPLTNWLEIFALLICSFSLTYTFGRYAGSQRQGWTIFAAMAIILLVGAVGAMHRGIRRQPAVPGRRRPGRHRQHGGQGDPLRRRDWRAVHGRHDGHQHRRDQLLARQLPSRSPGWSRCSTWSSVRSPPAASAPGMYGMLVIGAILAVFIAGLMVGRTPEYLGKKVEAFEIKMAMLIALVLGASILGFTAIASVTPEGTAGPLNPGPHGFSEILYAFSSQTGNNGSAFAGLTGNTPFYNVTGGLAMLIGRYGMIVPILALAGSMAAKRSVAPSLGTFPTTGVLWVVLLIGVVIIVGALTFFPALALGPIVEQLLQNAGKVS